MWWPVISQQIGAVKLFQIAVKLFQIAVKLFQFAVKYVQQPILRNLEGIVKKYCFLPQLRSWNMRMTDSI